MHFNCVILKVVFFMTFGETLRGLRKKKGQTQHDVAAALGISLRAYVGYEKDERRPRTRERLEKLAAYFDVDPATLTASDVTVEHAAQIQELTGKLARHQEMMKHVEESTDDLGHLLTSLGWTRDTAAEHTPGASAFRDLVAKNGERSLSIEILLSRPAPPHTEKRSVFPQLLRSHIEQSLAIRYGRLAMQDLPTGATCLLLSDDPLVIDCATAHPPKNLAVPVRAFLFTLQDGHIVSPDLVKFLASIS